MPDLRSDPRHAANATRAVAVTGHDDQHHDRSGGVRHDRVVLHDALTIASWGWSVLPCRPGAKVPATARGFHDATVDPDGIIDWWEATPTANVGIVTGPTSGLVVLDVDPGGDSTIRELIATVGPLPRTLVARTPRGGFHGYYRHPTDVRIPSSAGKFGPGVDVRAGGGYVVAPPSTVNGVSYTWRDDPWPGPPDLPELPAAWVDLLATRVAPERPPTPPLTAPAGVDSRLVPWVRAAVTGELEAVAGAREGTRNHRLNRAAFRLGQLVATGAVDQEQVLVGLEAAAVACGLPAGEARRTIASGVDAGQQQPAELPEVAA
jgi:hypothetical protein